MKDQLIRVRFAPSPTGLLHVGGLRTALFNFLFARKNSGKFILRIEDTDRSREVKGATDNIKETLELFGLRWDEGPIFQSQRLLIYTEHVNKLLENGAAYKCFCTQDRLADLKKQAELQKIPFRYDKHCLKNPPSFNSSPPVGEERRGGVFVIRQNVPGEGSTEFEDEIHGKIRVENRLLDDGILIKSDGWPVYNFANVVDDHLMGISHVIRGEEFIPSTPKHILLYRALGWDAPKFAHLPLLLDKKRAKLSKRMGDVAVKDYLEKGYLPEAILNFIAFLGWNPKSEREFFTLDELIAEFDLKKVNKSGAIFDIEKLDWYNAHYLKQKSPEERAKIMIPEKILKEIPVKVWELAGLLEPGRQGRGEEIEELTAYFVKVPKYEKELLRWKDGANEDIRKNLETAKSVITGLRETDKETIQKVFLEKIGSGDKGTMLWPLRVALTGRKTSPSPFEIIAAFMVFDDGKDRILKRIDSAIAKL